MPGTEAHRKKKWQLLNFRMWGMVECSSWLGYWNVKKEKTKKKKNTGKSYPIENKMCPLVPHAGSVGVPHSDF